MLPAYLHQFPEFLERSVLRIGRIDIRQPKIVSPALPIVPDHQGVGQAIAEGTLQSLGVRSVIGLPEIEYKTSCQFGNPGRGLKLICPPEFHSLPYIIRREKGDSLRMWSNQRVSVI